jgi:hypothetical protein
MITDDWINILQFKEMGYDNQGRAIQFPSWWLNVGPQSSFAHGNVSLETKNPVLFANYWNNTYVNWQPKTMPVPLGRWFEVRAQLYQGDRIDWYVNGSLFDTSYNSTYHVGRFYPVSTGWIYGVGHYGGYGSVLIDHCYVASNP